MLKYGLKLWSDNERYLSPAQRLYEEKIFDYVELYILPCTHDRYIRMWQDLHVDYIIHCTHSMHGFNLSVKGKLNDNLKMFSEAKAFCDDLDGKYIILHPGIGGTLKSSIEQIRTINDRRVLIENMPYMSMFGHPCVGSTYEELNIIMGDCTVGFCLDVPHAITTAFHLQIDSFAYMKQLLNLAPMLIHISDGIREKHDKHLHIGDGAFNFGEIGKIVGLSNAKYLTLETTKSRDDLSCFVDDLKKIREIEKDE